VSPYKGETTYQQFKTAEADLHLFLKQIQKSLKEASEDPIHKVNPILARFRKSQEDWFRKKAQLKAETGTVKTVPSTSLAATSSTQESMEKKTSGSK
jgi:hypothetical protein